MHSKRVEVAIMRPFNARRFLAILACAWLVPGCAHETDLAERSDPAAKANADPEDFCADWAEASCQTLATCCEAPGLFDDFWCYAARTDLCLSTVRMELVHADYNIFDPTAAGVCLGQLAGCEPVAPTAAQVAACHNVVTGYRLPGMACDEPEQCQRPKHGYATCYEGVEYGLDAVCADVVVSSDGHCSFAKDTSTLTVCPLGTYCSVPPPSLDPGDVLSDYFYAFEGDCEPLLGLGEVCVTFGDEKLTLLECASGLYCAIDPYDLEASACAPRLQIGESCVHYPSNECVDGAECDYDTDTCQSKSAEVTFCFEPPVCGNAECELGESVTTCIDDCGSCGDDHCAPQEEGACLVDCGYCGDGVCYWDEDPVSCPEDCSGFCGDGVCSGEEDLATCPLDCAICGDTICSPFEAGNCVPDCGEPCATCGEVLTGAEPPPLCEGTSADLYNTLIACVCEGACAGVCGDNICVGVEGPTTCLECVTDTMAGCGNEFNDCANDF